MKGIILAGGTGTRLYPLTKSVSKQLLPVYNKPMIYYPLSVLMSSGIRDILIISTPKDLPLFENLLGGGESLGIKISYLEQPTPDGLAQAFILGEDFIADQDVCLILGDNIFYGENLDECCLSAIKLAKEKKIATVFGYHVIDPERYGVLEFNVLNKVVNIIEKPKNPPSKFAVTGIYFFPNDVIHLAKHIIPSERGELEITDLNKLYLKEKRLNAIILEKGSTWLDTGTYESLLEASIFVETLEKRQGLKIACLEEIAFKNGYINAKELLKISDKIKSNEYGSYLKSLIGA